MKINHILVPVDFSEYSDRAAEYAIFLAETFGAKLTLLHAIVLFQEDIEEESHLEEYQKVVEIKEAITRKKLQQHNEAANSKGVEIHTELLRGISPADVILQYVADQEIDLVVMGTHGRTGIKKWIYGSVAEKVVRLSSVPVLTIHHPIENLEINKILVPVDFSVYSRQAIDFARSFAEQFHARVEFMHVIEQEIHPAYFTSEIESLFQLDPELKDRALQRLREFVDAKDNESVVVKEGKAYQEIIDHIRENNVDLTIMATRGKTGLEHFLIGSTTERVVRLATSPVLTVRQA